MQIDLTQEVSCPTSQSQQDRYRMPVLLAVVAAVALVSGWALGREIERKAYDNGVVALVGIRLDQSDGSVSLSWSLANFAREAGRVVAVTFDDRTVPVLDARILATAVTDFSTPISCSTAGSLQLSVKVIDGSGSKAELGYLVDRESWEAACGH